MMLLALLRRNERKQEISVNFLMNLLHHSIPLARGEKLWLA